MYLLTQLSIFDAVQNLKQIRQSEKIFKSRKFSATIAQAPVQTKNMIEKYSCIFSFSKKKNVDDCSLETTFFCGKCHMKPNDWSISEMNKFSPKTQ